MKNLLNLILVLFATLSYSQSETILVDAKASWNVAHSYPNSNSENPNFIETKTKVYGFVGDTLIDGQTWLKLYDSPDSTFSSKLTYLGNLKEESGIVLFMDTLDAIDTLYNFNLQVGDSVLYDFGTVSSYLQIESIDSIEIDGEYHKRFHFEEPNYSPMVLSEMWIEGIGSIHGPLFPKYPQLFETEQPDSLDLICYKLDESVVWNNDSYESCYINIVLSTRVLKKTQMQIYPNPVSDVLCIRSNNKHKIQAVSIFNMEGILIKTFYDKFTELNIKNIASGLYIVKIQSEEKEFCKKILIK